MTGWGFGFVLLGLFAVTAFVSYWWGCGAGERSAKFERYELRCEVNRLRDALITKAAEAERLQVNWQDRASLSAAEIDAWHVLICDLEDEDAA